MKKIITSVGMIVFVGALVAGGTGAFFSDTETSTGNVFTAGSIDLSLGSTFTSDANGSGDFSMETDNNGRTLFTFTDLKPGDDGTVVFNLEVDSNEAYACAITEEMTNNDNGINDPEADALDASDGAGNGELQNYLQFATFSDENLNNAYDLGEPVNVNQYGAGDNNGFTNAEIAAAGWVAVADTSAPNTWLIDATLTPGTPYNAGMLYCFGDFIITGDDNSAQVTGCDGGMMGEYNDAQTDSATGAITFSAVQTRNNGDFTCASQNVVVPPPVVLVGADLSDFVASTCTVTVLEGESIQAAIDANLAGSTICVAPGTHDTDTYPLRVNKDNMTLTSTAGSATTILNGGVILDNDGTEVSGFTLTSSTLLGETFGVYINTGADGVSVAFNDMNGPGVGSGRGVVNAIGVTTALIANNEISNYLTGVFMNSSSGMIVEDNDLVANGVGSGNDNPMGNIVRGNHITGNTIEGVGVFSTGAESIEVNLNNIFGNGGVANELNSYAVDAVDAEDNWWGDLTPADEIGGVGSASVDFIPFAVAVYTQN